MIFVWYKFHNTMKNKTQKKNQKTGPSPTKGVLAKLNDNPEDTEKATAFNKKKGIISKMNSNPEKKREGPNL